MRRAVAVLIAVTLLAAPAAAAEPEGDGFHALPTPAELRQAANLIALADWVAAVEYAEWLRAAEYAQAVADARAAEARAAEAARQTARTSSGRCGGTLPPCYVMMRESGGNITAQNPRSTASGKWQFLDSTWAGYGGYAKARHAPESVQDAKARQLWDGGRGCSHWSAC